MRISIHAIGRVKAGAERELISRYQSRFTGSGKNLGLSGLEIIELNESRASTSDLRCKDEAARLLDTIPDGAFVIALDERGKNISSKEFANKIRGQLEDGCRAVSLVIGGADGHGDAIRKRANMLLSFGQLTWPHQLVRVLLVEQLYRATTILSGHPYHRE